MAENKFHISSSPHFTEGFTTQKVMLAVILALLPEVAAGVVFLEFSPCYSSGFCNWCSFL